MNSIPFTTEQFLEVFKDYNLAVWPMPVVLYVMAVFAVFLGTRKAPASDKVVTFILAFFWLWMGGMYHISFFAEINKAAYIFGALFVVQAAMFYYHKKDLVFRFHRDVYGITGAVLMFFALVVYPMWSYVSGHDFPAIPTFGLPCPTTIFTFGMLLWTDKKCPLSLLAIPLLWSLIGFSAVVLLGMTEDAGLLVAGLTATALLVRRERQMAV
ncbi:MAG: hypothetical protein DYG98_23380 [Haliscomenobacteraceae bacterium CHB4]|nr:hypothetical protein [Saprospiraceae bacterium]MCE7926002.1 hypothetical protein [Haliscomenobacteraceae bacterium CHB4]